MVSARTGMVIINRGMWIMENACDNENETLLMFGDSENIANPKPIVEYSHIAPHSTLRIWPNCFHEIHNEPEKETIFNFTLNWIKERNQGSK
jgi:alpha-beta hydrolase superfamily lysophospholipase